MNDENTLNINLVDVVNNAIQQKNKFQFITMFLICGKKTKFILSESKVKFHIHLSLI